MIEHSRNTMITGAPSKKEFHFAGVGVWHNKTILAETREEAEKLWHETKELVDPSIPIVEIEQSTPTPAPETAQEGIE